MADPRHEMPARADRTPSRPDRGARIDRLLVHSVDGSLAGCIFVLPFLLGGQHAGGRLLLVTLAVAAAVAWSLRGCLKAGVTWTWSPAELLPLAAAALLVMQMTPLSRPMLETLSPHVAKLLPLWNAPPESPGRLGTWSTVSLEPAATRASLVMLLAYSLLFSVTVRRVRAVEDVERLLRWIAVSATVTAGFGLVQLFTSNGKFFWFYERPFTDTSSVAKAAFGNRNHFAHFLALGTGPLIWWLQQRFRRCKGRPGRFSTASPRPGASGLGTTVLVLALGTVLFAVLLSLSRAGALVTGLAVAVSAAVCYRAKSAGAGVVAGLAAVALLLAVSLAIFGHERVSSRLDDLAAGSLEAVDPGGARRAIWSATLTAIPHYLVVGSGAGSFREIAPMYLESKEDNRYFGYAENGYLQIALETGLAGLALTLAGVAVCGFWCAGGLRAAVSKRELVCMGAVTAALAASAAHSLGDFVWYNPACMTLAVILAACACRLWRLSRNGAKGSQRDRVLRRPLQGAAVAGLVIVGAWMIHERIGPALAAEPLVRFQRLSLAAPDPPGLLTGRPAAAEAMPAERGSVALEARMKAELEKVVRWNPDDARAHLDLAACCIRLFEFRQQHALNVMALEQIRDAAIQSRFPSRQALDEWLARAVGDHDRYLDSALRHARRAVALCPLLGDAYLYLSELCFLENGDAPAQKAYLAQAIRVRPFDGTVLFHAGREAWLAGDTRQGLGYWRRAFRCGGFYQRQMIDWLVGRTRPEDLEEEIRFFLGVFQPDLEALAYLDARYRKIARPDQTIALRRAYADALESEAKRSGDDRAGALWLKAARLHAEMADNGRAIAAAEHARRCRPNNFHARWMLAHCLAEEGRDAEAEEQIAWCLERQPDDRRLNDLYKQVVKRRIGGDIRAAGVGRTSRSVH